MRAAKAAGIPPELAAPGGEAARAIHHDVRRAKATTDKERAKYIAAVNTGLRRLDAKKSCVESFRRAYGRQARDSISGLGQDKVSEYGAFGQTVYDQQLWKQPPPPVPAGKPWQTMQ